MGHSNTRPTKNSSNKGGAKGFAARMNRPRESPPSPLHHLRSSSPCRPHDWLWQRAKIQVADRRYRTKNQDETVTRLIAYLRVMETHPKRASAVWPALAETIALREVIAPSVRARLEAYLLAGESNEGISKRLKIPSEVVGVYESVFYAVRDQPVCPALFIWELVRKAGGFVHENDWETLIRLIGLMGGPYVLDSYLEYLLQPPPVMPITFDGMYDDELRALRNRLLIRAYVIGLFPEVTPKNQKQWDNIAIFAELREQWFRPDMCNAGRS